MARNRLKGDVFTSEQQALISFLIVDTEDLMNCLDADVGKLSIERYFEEYYERWFDLVRDMRRNYPTEFRSNAHVRPEMKFQENPFGL